MSCRLRSTRVSIAALVMLLSACSTASQGSAGESASAAEGASPGSAQRIPLPVPESLPRSEPSMRQALPDVAAPAGADTGKGALATIARLEREARKIAKSSGCSSVAACRTAPVGAKACGGPRTYIVYCAATTDTVALARKLRELERVEKAYNATSGMMSTCEMRLPPTTALVAGSCREASGPN